MIPRTPEPEVMGEADEADEYDRMDHSTVNIAFADDFYAACNPAEPPLVVDVGTGTALIPLVAIPRYPFDAIVAVDRSMEMLLRATRNIATQQAGERIRTALCDCRRLPFGDDEFDAAMSNSIVHHLVDERPDEFVSIGELFREMLRVTRKGGVIFVRDLCRPSSDEHVEILVERYAGDETDFARQLFRQSLHAALTVSEVASIAAEVPFQEVQVTMTSDRHWTLVGRK